MTITIGSELSRFMIYSMYMFPNVNGANQYTLDAFLETDYSRKTAKLIEGETFNSNDDYIALPNTPAGAGGASSIIGLHPITSSMYLVPNGDKLVFVCENMEDSDDFNLTIKCYLRGKIPDINVSGGSLNYTFQNKLR